MDRRKSMDLATLLTSELLMSKQSVKTIYNYTSPGFPAPPFPPTPTKAPMKMVVTTEAKGAKSMRLHLYIVENIVLLFKFR